MLYTDIFNKKEFVSYGKKKFADSPVMPITAKTIFGEEVRHQINHIEYHFVTKDEFDSLRNRAEELGLPIIHTDVVDDTNGSNRYNGEFAMLYFLDNKMVVIGSYTTKREHMFAGSGFNGIESITTRNTNEEKLSSFLQTNCIINSAMLRSIAASNAGSTEWKSMKYCAYILCGGNSENPGFTTHYLDFDFLIDNNFN